MNSIRKRNNLGEFLRLTKLGVKNFFTNDNREWGNMKYTEDPEALSRYLEIFKLLKIEDKEYLHMWSKHNNEVQLIDEINLPVYKKFNREEEVKGAVLPLVVHTDSIITKLSMPIVIAPADCAVVIMTGVDRKDSRRFAIILHAGLFGTILQVVEKSLRIAHLDYDFENSDLEVFIFPYIRGENYTKDERIIELFKEFDISPDDWVEERDGEYEVHFGKELKRQLTQAGVRNTFETEIDTFKAHREGKLYSHTFSKGKKQHQGKRFAVGICIEKSQYLREF